GDPERPSDAAERRRHRGRLGPGDRGTRDRGQGPGDLRRARGGGRARMILLVDNYDSFTYNLYQYLGELGADVKVIRNDALSVDAALGPHPQRVRLLPGPGPAAQ